MTLRRSHDGSLRSITPESDTLNHYPDRKWREATSPPSIISKATKKMIMLAVSSVQNPAGLSGSMFWVS